MKIHLGVIEQKYANSKESVGTGDVAEILEDHYGILQTFVNWNIKDIAKDMASSLAGSLETMMMGGPHGDPFAAAMDKTQTRAKKFISSQEAERRIISGRWPVPTGAALKGINHRKKNPRTGIRRPSFIDTGLYQNSLKAWVEE